MAVKQLADGGSDGASLGQAATDKISFHGVTPVVQSAISTVPVATGATNTTPYGFVTAAQADAIVTYIRALDTYLRLKGLIT